MGAQLGDESARKPPVNIGNKYPRIAGHWAQGFGACPRLSNYGVGMVLSMTRWVEAKNNNCSLLLMSPRKREGEWTTALSTEQMPSLQVGENSSWCGDHGPDAHMFCPTTVLVILRCLRKDLILVYLLLSCMAVCFLWASIYGCPCGMWGGQTTALESCFPFNMGSRGLNSSQQYYMASTFTCWVIKNFFYVPTRNSRQ